MLYHIYLKSCPFCGCKTIDIITEALFLYAWCTDCGVQGKQFRVPAYTSHKNWKLRIIYKIIKHWNTRSNTC